ncbi:dTMP kinase [Candidatus Micrarchaeota archaeon CG10_big_fil_rev_8_21_14_0_10_45_29]|nr:MAG: dTMP kinase [Candidatus Micrarchaeota archaeon CG10_big_fil_rev_8_21_14_0_10_45_29]
MAYPFIVIEGIDGSGKAGQAQMVINFIKRLRVRHFLHKYPTEEAKRVFAHLEGKKNVPQDELFEEFLNDIKNSQEKLNADLLKGWVVSDRYCHSTAAYQGVGGKLGERMREIEREGLLKPNMVFWLDLSVEEAMKRKAGQKSLDKHEADAKLLLEVRENYEKLYANSFMAGQWHRIDAAQESKKVFEQIKKKLEF